MQYKERASVNRPLACNTFPQTILNRPLNVCNKLNEIFVIFAVS